VWSIDRHHHRHVHSHIYALTLCWHALLCRFWLSLSLSSNSLSLRTLSLSLSLSLRTLIELSGGATPSVAGETTTCARDQQAGQTHHASQVESDSGIVLCCVSFAQRTCTHTQTFTCTRYIYTHSHAHATYTLHTLHYTHYTHTTHHEHHRTLLLSRVFFRCCCSEPRSIPIISLTSLVVVCSRSPLLPCRRMNTSKKTWKR
jgi:hypothetical protein